MKSSFVNSLKVLVLALAVGLGVSYLSAQTGSTWTGPTATPPNGNVPAPFNASSNFQYKLGPVSFGTSTQVTGAETNVQGTGLFGALAVAGDSAFTGNVRIATGTPSAGEALIAQDSNGTVGWGSAGSGINFLSPTPTTSLIDDNTSHPLTLTGVPSTAKAVIIAFAGAMQTLPSGGYIDISLTTSNASYPDVYFLNGVSAAYPSGNGSILTLNSNTEVIYPISNASMSYTFKKHNVSSDTATATVVGYFN
jgi:hypothetical protein